MLTCHVTILSWHQYGVKLLITEECYHDNKVYIVNNWDIKGLTVLVSYKSNLVNVLL